MQVDRSSRQLSSATYCVSGYANITFMRVASSLLLQARRATGLSQAALARKAGVPRSVLNAYERGFRQPGADSLAAILAAAGFELGLRPRIDLARNAQVLAQVLDLAERLPWRPRKRVTYPPFNLRAR